MSIKLTANAKYHHLGVFRRTTELIFSVTVVTVWPGAMIGMLAGTLAGGPAGSMELATSRL
jgi:hypothetical protein